VAAGAPSPKLSYRGVVYNEMKGVYSSPDAVIGYASEAALFPDTAYAHSSGGDPLAIPALTFDEFQVRAAT
jgi:presequence protease